VYNPRDSNRGPSGPRFERAGWGDGAPEPQEENDLGEPLAREGDRPQDVRVTENWWIDPLVTAAIVALMLWILEPMAYRLGLLDHPGGRKDHGHPTPLIGGLAMAIGIMIPVAIDGAYPRSYLGFMLGATLLVAVGLLDDIKDVRWWWRVVAQVTAALVMVYVGGVRVEYLGQVFGAEAFDLGVWSVPFTVFATVGVINAFNMSDGVDGLAGCLAVAALTMYCAAAVYSGNTFMVDRLAPVIAAVSVFLLFNMRHPWRSRARVFMGNAGSAFLGYLIAWTCFRLTQNQNHPVTPVLAPWFVAPPIIDCLTLIVRRAKQGRSPFAAGRDHMHHLLLDAGFSPTQVALGLTAVSFALGLAAALALYTDRIPDTLLVVAFVALTVAYYWFTRDWQRAIAAVRRFAPRRAPPDSSQESPAMPEPDLSPADTRIAVVGLGYVGLPLAVEFARHFPTVGFDINAARVAELRAGRDGTLEVSEDELRDAAALRYTDQLAEIAGCNIYIVTVPTPIDGHKRPDFTPLVRASDAIGSVLKRGDLVIYESTVYPGATEEVCVPRLERASGLRFNEDFTVGYSPERINPGDRARRLTTIPKVTSGSTPEAARYVDALYRRIVTAGTHLAPSLRVAEAAKVIENTQRDANIALINEFALIFHRLGIDTHDVLAAAGTKWNFLPFKPGLVGGHCIGVDPYYLIQKAQEVGYYPDILLACRRINDAMGRHVAAEVIKAMVRKGQAVSGARVLLLGFTFKEDCPDLRNTRVIDLVDEFRQFSAEVDVYDPWASRDEARHEYGLELMAELPETADYDAVVICVGHREFREMGAARIRALTRADSVLYDIKSLFPRAEVDGRL
jgi:UDP-N-acetyl-D-galactosamine dehydrogenase